MSDITLHHTDTGSGEPTILFVHGFSSGLEDWDAQVTHLSSKHRVIAPALRGHGRSPRGTADMTIPQLARDCVELVRGKGLSRTVVAGHSMGTRVAFEIARQAPELVCGLILVDGSNTALAGKETALAAFDKIVAEQGYGTYARALFEAMFFDEKHAALASRLVDRALAIPEETARSLYRNMIEWDGDVAQQVMTATKLPVLVLQSTTRGADNERRTLTAGETGAYETLIKTHIPDAMVVSMPGLGHFVTYEEPAAVNAAIDGFLDETGLA